MSEEKKEIQGIPLPGEPDKIPDFLKGDNWFGVETKELYLDFTKPYVPPRWTLSHDGTPFAKRGDLHVIQGKPGHGKTALMTQFMACLLCGEFGHLRCELKEPPKVLYIDTEMSEDDTIAIKNRVCSLAKIPYDQPSDRFKVVRLRETELAHERWQQILKVIWEQKPTVCFLDGMLDIVEDYNDQKECQPIIRKCMKLVTHYDMSMWCVLHENPMADKMVGTLGSITQRKVTEALSVKKHKFEKDKYPNKPDIWFEVLQPKARGKDQDEWAFEVASVESWGVPVELPTNGSDTDSTPPPQANTDEAVLKAVVKCLLEFISPPASDYLTNIVRELKKRMHVGESKAKSYFTMANDANVFHLPVNGRYTLHTEMCDAILNDLPFANPDK